MRRCLRASCLLLSAFLLLGAFSLLYLPGAASQTAPTAFPDTADGLKAFLQSLAEVAAGEDSAKAATVFHSVQIPDPGTFFYDLVGPDTSKRLVLAYSVNPIARENELRKQLATLKTQDRQLFVSLLVASAAHRLAPLEQALSDAMKQRQLFYSAKLVDLNDNSVIPLGYFVQVAGAFRFVDLATLEALDPSKPLRIRQFTGGPVAKALHKPSPVFPDEAREQHLSGNVVLEVVIGTDGSVKEVKPLSGPTLLVEAARTAVLQWTFEPPTFNGAPIELVIPVEMTFNLTGGQPGGSSPELYRPLPATAPPTSYPEKAGGLDKELHDLTKARNSHGQTTEDAILRSFVLPDPEKWFVQTFGEDAGKHMAEQYLPFSHALVQALRKTFDNLEDMKFTGIEVRKFDKPCDPDADDYVYPLLLARSQQVPLYEATFRNGNSYQKMNSFVFVDGAFRYIGRINIPDSLLFDEMKRKASDSPPSPSTAKPVKLAGNVASGRLIKRVAPIYPEDAVRNHIQGTVRLLAVIQEDGSIGELRVARGVCPLANAAIFAVKQWRYQPFLFNGQAVRIYTTIETNFTLTH